MAERSKAADSRDSLFVLLSVLFHNCGRGFESHFWQNPFYPANDEMGKSNHIISKQIRRNLFLSPATHKHRVLVVHHFLCETAFQRLISVNIKLAKSIFCSSSKAATEESSWTKARVILDLGTGCEKSWHAVVFSRHYFSDITSLRDHKAIHIEWPYEV